MSDWILTIPKTVAWEDYQNELDVVADGSQELNYRTGRKFKVVAGDRMFVCHKGYVKGWMRVSANHWIGGWFQCSTTGRKFPPGNYIKRTGTFHIFKQKIPYKGFQGVRRFQMTDDYIQEETQKGLELE